MDRNVVSLLGTPMSENDTPQFNLCRRCLDITWGPGIWQHLLTRGEPIEVASGYIRLWEPAEYAVAAADLRTAAETGCWWCALLWEQIAQNLKEGRDPLPSYVIQMRLWAQPKWYSPPRIQSISINFLHERGQAIMLGAFTTSHSVASDLFIQAQRPRIGSHSFNVHRCQMWLDECLSSHRNCSKGSTSYLPTRILDLSLEDEISIHVQSSHSKTTARYIALSYRWGGPQQMTLTSSTLKTLQKGIKLDIFPRTLKDAVTVTKQLGFRYLWVDALCIFQDSLQDKATEILKMDSFLETDGNVLPMAPQASTYPTEKQLLKMCTVPYVDTKGQRDIITLEQNPTTFDPWKEPLHQRAWVLQERLLSRRAIIFPSVGGLIWQCKEGKQVDGTVYPSSLSDEGLEPLISHTSQQPQPHQINDSWRNIIEDYSGREMTDSTDKLIAISALAEHYHECYGSTLGAYCAGLWDNFLLRDLNWVHSKDSLMARPKFYRAPTWSWAAVDGKHTAEVFEDGNGHVLAEVQKCQTIPTSSKMPFGAVRSGCLEIKGFLIQGVWSEDSQSMEFRDGRILADLRSVHIKDYPDTSDDKPSDMEIFHCLPLRTRSEFMQDLAGLLLKPTDNGMYHRVGSFEAWVGLKVDPRTWFDQQEPQVITII
ncbi:hypothetical protein GJ744_005238 [Endocarpon pusillum]|uniref:Heterokaryon incompatibility domain-containing protein n=1 Tax=Endocarpon pusillum TaxID=364733 RepID=A0A8H7A834_9EURO|nr:hypothetical protein GJ744_005238 [Endocarpon pusillum]